MADPFMRVVLCRRALFEMLEAALTADERFTDSGANVRQGTLPNLVLFTPDGKRLVFQADEKEEARG